MSLTNSFLIALALSMDTFSLSLGISLLSKNNKTYFFPFIVGIFHFIFPIIGSILGDKLLTFIPIAANKLLGLIFLFLFFKLLKDFIFNNDIEIKTNIINLLLLSILVSIDSLITGIGLTSTIKTSILPLIIFSIVSFSFTFLGLKIGKVAKKELGNIANIIGLILLISLSIIHLCK